MRTLHALRLRAEGIADAVAAVVSHGGTVIFPTDTVYGLGCDPMSTAAVETIFVLKGRPAHKPLSLHFASVAELLEYAPNCDAARRVAQRFLPGPLTLIVRRPSFVGSAVTRGGDTIGLRVPKHALCATILERCGPLAATSANYSGLPAFAGTAKEPLPAADLLVDDGPTPIGVESTIVDVSTGELRLVREGAINVELLERELGAIVPARSGRGEAR
ncbi:MAG: L-threonylcarbamoyladenylate synthase [Candidatus Eremiobacteraeota bacterium]|nr:L-threonylcarbamoyladenylate synthase [Candidatus Eremiobacteraeota bacterium]